MNTITWTKEIAEEYANFKAERMGREKYIMDEFIAMKILHQQKDWGILRVQHKERKTFWSNDVFSVYDWQEKVLNKLSLFEIHSVKRLSDNSVFTVKEETNYGVIEKFFIGWAGMEVHFTNGNGATFNSIEKIQKPKETDAFVWSDELIEEYARIREVEYTTPYLKKNKTSVAEFKESKSKPKEEDKIDITGIERDKNYQTSFGAERYKFYSSIPIPPEKYEPIKRAIEEILNQKM